jgi:hypothetical protein
MMFSKVAPLKSAPLKSTPTMLAPRILMQTRKPKKNFFFGLGFMGFVGLWVFMG